VSWRVLEGIFGVAEDVIVVPVRVDEFGRHRRRPPLPFPLETEKGVAKSRLLDHLLVGCPPAVFTQGELGDISVLLCDTKVS
jgi:hypothetical protein